MIPPRFDITPDQIDRVVATFYAAVRQHPGLGPVFAAHVTDWPAHEEKIARFWRNAILHQRSYDGNPMAVHRAAGNVRPPMFEVWLGLFDSVLRRELPAETAAQWSALAHRIGAGLRFAEWALTQAERDVALFAIKGLSTAEIAAVRQTSEGTVKAQTNAIYRKAGVSGRPQLLSLFIDDLMRDDGTIRPQLSLPAPGEQRALPAK